VCVYINLIFFMPSIQPHPWCWCDVCEANQSRSNPIASIYPSIRPLPLPTHTYTIYSRLTGAVHRHSLESSETIIIIMGWTGRPKPPTGGPSLFPLWPRKASRVVRVECVRNEAANGDSLPLLMADERLWMVEFDVPIGFKTSSRFRKVEIEVEVSL
jgi:hypothetical protein